jgi:hypothetical protein
MSNETKTLHAYVCPHCGAKAWEGDTGYSCGTEPWYDDIGSYLVRSNTCYSNENFKLKAEIERLTNKLEETQDGMKFIMDEKCVESEVHCGCVPLLKINFKEAKAEIERLKQEKNRIGVDIRGEYLPKLKELQAEVERLTEQVKLYKGYIVAHGLLHCAEYGKQHFGKEVLLHPEHYDLLKEAGCRMNAYKKATPNLTRQMNEEKARSILKNAIQDDGITLSHLNPYMFWSPGYKEIILDGELTTEKVEAIAWWMREYGSYKNQITKLTK